VSDYWGCFLYKSIGKWHLGWIREDSGLCRHWIRDVLTVYCMLLLVKWWYGEQGLDLFLFLQIKYEKLQDLLADEEVRQYEEHRTDAPGIKHKRSESLSSRCSDGVMSPSDIIHGK